MLKKIVVKGAKEHNLKNVSLEIPKEKLVVINGLSGSGKSSLAFDTIYAEGQRRYVESLSSYARQFLDKMKKPKVDLIEGLSLIPQLNQLLVFSSYLKTAWHMKTNFPHIFFDLQHKLYQMLKMIFLTRKDHL